MNKSIDFSKQSDWLNRSHDHSPHERLYNEAKHMDAKLNHRIRMYRKPDVDGCTFQPKLITNSKLTRRLWASRVKSMESRNSMLQQSIQALYPGKFKVNMKNIVADNSFNSPDNRVLSSKSSNKRKKSQRMKNYL